MNKFKILTAFVLASILFSAFYYFTADKPEIYLGIKSGESENSVAQKLQIQFVSGEAIKSQLYSGSHFFIKSDSYLSKIGDILITPGIRNKLKFRYATIPLLKEQAILKVTFYDDKAFHVQVKFNLISGDERTAANIASIITKEVQANYPKYELKKENENTYNLYWFRPPVMAALWVNIKDADIHMSYSNDSVLDELKEKQKALSATAF